MRKRLIFLAGVGVGYVMGTRAGRERYERMRNRVRRIWESPTVQEAAGVVQAQANKLYDEGKHAVTGQVHRLSRRNNWSVVGASNQTSNQTSNQHSNQTSNRSGNRHRSSRPDDLAG